MTTMTAIWDESVAFIKRESALLVPLLLATFVVGDAGMTLINGTMSASGGQLGAASGVGAMLALLLTMTGQLAVTVMVLRDRVSVGEAIRLGLTRLPKLLIIGLMFVSVALLALLPVVIILVGAGYDLTAARPNLPLWSSVVFLAFAGVAIWLGVRLSTLTALIVDRDPPLVQGIKNSFAMTSGYGWRILGVFILYGLVALVLGGVARFVFGGAFVLLGGAIGMPGLGMVLAAIASGVVGGALAMMASIFMAHLYRAIVKGSTNGI